MKTLVVFYSRTGITRKVAETIARVLSGDVEEIVAREDRSDFSGYGLWREEAVLKKPAAIKATNRDPARYDLTIVGTPIWVQTVSSPERAYISRKRKRFTRVAFFSTQDVQEQRARSKRCKNCATRPRLPLSKFCTKM